MSSVRTLLALALSLSAAAAAAPTMFSTAGRMLRDDGFMKTLPEQSMRCLSANQTEVSEEACAQLSYVEKVHNLFTDMSAASARSAELDKVELDTSGYASQFEHKVVRNIPFKGSLSQTKFSAPSALSTCIMEYGLKMNELSKDISVAECRIKNEELFRETIVPEIVANNYLPRWSAAREENPEDMHLLDYRSQWPAFLPLYDLTPVVHQCPVGLHMVVWGAKGSVKARLYGTSSAHQVLRPSVGSEVPHYVQYAESGFAPTMPSSSFSETTLEEGQFLFVPRTMVVSFDSRAAGDNNALLKSCFVDASNLMHVREMIALEAKMAVSSKQWLSEIDTLSFEYAVSRNPVAQPLLSGGNTVEAARGAEVVSEKKPNRRNRGASGMRDLSEAATWANLITSLTLPMPTPPIIYDTDLSSATVEWSSHFAPTSVDKTVFGFTLRMCEARNKSFCYVQDFPKEKLAGTPSTKDANSIVYQTRIKTFLIPGVEYIVRVNMYYGSSVGYASEWSSIASTRSIKPPSRIMSPVVAKLWAKDASKADVTFKLPDENGGALITGYNVFVREVQKAHAFSEMRSLGLMKPVLSPEGSSDVAVVVSHLAPGTKYVFFVSPQNLAGAGPLSSSSAEVETPWVRGKDGEIVSISGHTAEIYALPPGTPSFPLPPDGSWNPAKRTLVVHNHADTVTLMDEGKKLLTIPAWGSHWNANMNVAAQAAWMDPPDGKGVLINAKDLQNRLAVVQRGGVTFVHKARAAQMAGAVGVIIVDDGTCTKFNQACVPGSSKVSGEGFAAADIEKAWSSIRIPLFLVLQPDWDKLMGRWKMSPAEENRLLEPSRERIRLAALKKAEAEAAKGGEL